MREMSISAEFIRNHNDHACLAGLPLVEFDDEDRLLRKTFFPEDWEDERPGLGSRAQTAQSEMMLADTSSAGAAGGH